MKTSKLKGLAKYTFIMAATYFVLPPVASLVTRVGVSYATAGATGVIPSLSAMYYRESLSANAFLLAQTNAHLIAGSLCATCGCLDLDWGMTDSNQSAIKGNDNLLQDEKTGSENLDLVLSKKMRPINPSQEKTVDNGDGWIVWLLGLLNNIFGPKKVSSTYSYQVDSKNTPKASELVSLPGVGSSEVSNVNIGLKSTEMPDHMVPRTNSVMSF